MNELSLPHDAVADPPQAACEPEGGGAALKLAAAGAALAFLGALLLWWRFGPAIFVDALNAVWTCL